VEVLATPDQFEQWLVDNADSVVSDRNDIALNPISTYLYTLLAPIRVYCYGPRIRVANNYGNDAAAPEWCVAFLAHLRTPYRPLGACPVRGDEAIDVLRNAYPPPTGESGKGDQQ